MSTSPEDLAALIKSKYADYADVPDRELVARIVSKYPDYQSQLPAFNVDGAQKLRGASPQLVQHYLNLYDQFQQAGIKPIVRSGMRTAEQEYYLYTHGYPTKGNTGYGSNISPHQEGRAIDFSFAPEQREKGRAILAQYAQANGLHVPSDEPWHIAIPKNTREMMAYEPDIEQSSEMYDVGGQQQGTPTAQQPTPQGQQAQTVSTQTISPYDLEWHLGVPAGQAGEWFNGLPKAKQSQVFREVSKAMAKDEQKKAAGIQLTPSTDYQSGMRKRLKVAAPVPQEPGVVTAPTSVLPQIGGDLSMSNVVADARKRRDMRTPEQANDSRLMEQAVKNVSGFTVSPTANLKTLYRAVAKGLEGGFQADVEDEFNKLKGQQGRSETPEMITERAAYGNMPAAVRGVVAPVSQFYGGLLKDLGGVASVLGIAPNRLSDYLNTRGQFMEEAATNAPLKISGQYVQMPSKGASMFDAPYNQKQIAEIKRGLPEKVESTIANLGLGITKLVLMKEVTGLSMGQIMPIETAFQTSNDPLEDRIAAIAQARVLGQVLDSHLSRLVSAAIFGGPTAVEQGEQYAKGNIPLSEAILQTGLQSGIGFALGGKGLRFGREPLPEPITLTKVPDTFPEEVASGSPKTADWIRQQNEAFTSRLRAAENRGDTAEADRLRAQQSGLQERLGKIMARVVPPEPGREASPELQQRVQRAMESELRRTISRPTEPEIGDKQFTGLNNDQLQDLINARPKKGTTKAKRAQIVEQKFAAEKELERRLAEPSLVPAEPPATSLQPEESDVPSFKDYVENRPQGGIPFDTLFPGTPEYNMLVREYTELYGQKGAQTNAGQRTQIQSQRGQAGEGDRQIGSEARNAAEASQVSGLRNGEQTQARQITALPNGQFQVVIETSQGAVKRTFNTREGAEAQLAKLPRVPEEPAISAPAERTNIPLQTSTEVPPQPTAVEPVKSPVEAAQPVQAETTATRPQTLEERQRTAAAQQVAAIRPEVLKGIESYLEETNQSIEEATSSADTRQHRDFTGETAGEIVARLEERGVKATESEVEDSLYALRHEAKPEELDLLPQPLLPKPAPVISHSKPELDGAKVIGKTEGGAKLKVEKKDGTRTVIQNPRGPLGNREASVSKNVPAEPLKPIPIISGGNEATATQERGNSVQTRYAVVEANDLVTSHDDFQNPNERMSAPEQAGADARKISGQLLSVFRPSESGEINTAANHGFIQAFVRDVINPAEVGEYVDARGAISQAGISRIRNAIFARAYGDSPEGLRALEKIAESPDNNVRNITNALLQRAGGFASLKEGIADGTRYDSLDVTSDLTKALSKMSALREQDQTVEDYLNQNELFEPELTPLQRQMLHVLDEYKRSGKAVSEVLGNYLELTEAAGNPNQEGLFGTRDTAPDPSDLFEAAARKAAEDANAGKGKPANQTGLFASQGVPPEPSTGSGRLSTPSSAGEPDNQSGGGLFEANQSTESAGGAESSPLGFGRGRTKPPPPLPTTEPELRDVQRQMTPGSGNTHGEVVDGLLSLTLPSAKSPAHLRVAEMLGRRIGEMNRRAESASSLLGRWITKFYKLGVDRGDVEPKDNAGVQFASAMATGGKVDPSLEPAAKLIKVLFDGRLRLLEEAGVPLQQVRDNYFPGMWTRESRVAFNAGLQDAIEQGVIKEGEDLNASSPEQRQWVRDRVNQYMEQGNGSDRDMLSYLTRRPLAGKESFKKEKVFDDILTAQEFGLRPNSNNPAEIVKVKLSEIDRSIMAHQHFQDLSKAPAAPQFADSFRALLRDRGVTGDRLNEPVAQIQRISPYEQVPQGWIKVNDKYGTIYGPPTIEVSEHIDKAVYQGLLDVANKLGISHERVAALRGGNLGLSYQGENRIQTKFATETSVMAHEIGHQLDAKYDLWNNLLRTQPKSGEPGKGFRAGRGELRDIADMAERGKVSRSKEEKIAQVLEAYIHAPERMQEVAPRVYKWFDNFVKTTPELAPLADIKPGIALQKLTTQKYVGLPILGYRIVPEPVGDILNNYLSSSLYNSQYFGKPFKAWMATASVLNQSQLGVGSAFHASFTSGDVQTAAGANMIKDIYGVVRGNRDAGDVASSFGKWTTAIVRTPIVGDRVLNAWRNPDGVMDPKIAQVVRAAELAQGGFKLERGLKTEQTDKMVSDWYSGHRIKAALRSPIAGTELMAKPIMEWIVPREKGGAFADMAWRIIEQNPGKSMEELTPDFRKAWNRIDGRLGQVRYDRIFANNVAKNVTQGLIRAPGWSGGTLAELGGAFKDLGSFAKEWAQTGKAPQELPDRVAYGMSLLISTAVVNGALTYAFTGQRPHGMDFFAFRNGNKDKDGNETRLLIPSYMKDILAYYEEGPSALLSKTHPLISLVNDVVIKNKDYFGTEIRDPNDPYYKQGEEVAKYVLKAFIPFWIRGVQRQQEQGGGYGRMAASYMGVMPAPSYLIQSDATKDLNQMIKDKLPAVRTPPTDRQEAMKEIIQGRRKGEDTSADLLAARQEGLINKRDVQRIGEQGRIDPMEAKLQSVYRDYGLSGVLDWYERHESYLDPEMKTDAQKVIRRARLSLAQHPENMRGDAQQRQEMMRRINSALGLKTVPQPPPTTAQTPNAPM